MTQQSKETTDFGFQTVDKDEKQTMVAKVFHSVASKYDLMNDLMSFGIHRVWKRYTIEASGVRRNQRVLDLAGGTGDLTAKFSRLVGENGEVVLADINDSMLKWDVRNCVITVLLVMSVMYKRMQKSCHSLMITLTVSLSRSVYVM